MENESKMLPILNNESYAYWPNHYENKEVRSTTSRSVITDIVLFKLKFYMIMRGSAAVEAFAPAYC